VSTLAIFERCMSTRNVFGNWRLRFRQAVALPRAVCTMWQMLLVWQDWDINWRWSVQR
jgi:hypothetical protein